MWYLQVANRSAEVFVGLVAGFRARNGRLLGDAPFEAARECWDEGRHEGWYWDCQKEAGVYSFLLVYSSVWSAKKPSKPWKGFFALTDSVVDNCECMYGFTFQKRQSFTLSTCFVASRYLSIAKFEAMFAFQLDANHLTMMCSNDNFLRVLFDGLDNEWVACALCTKYRRSCLDKSEMSCLLEWKIAKWFFIKTARISNILVNFSLEFRPGASCVH